MTSNRNNLGIDYRSGRYYTARVCESDAGHKVTALVTTAKSELNVRRTLENGDVIFSVPDNEIMVKRLNLTETNEWNSDILARFELSQSLLDDEGEFYFAALSTGQTNRCLGLVTRRRSVERLAGSLLSLPDLAGQSLRCEMRAVALGKGYLNFCHPEQGELICLADFGDNIVSICFVSGTNVIGLAHLPFSRFDLNSEQGIKRMAVEFKTVVNFELPSLFERGVTSPLSALIVTGHGGDGSVKSALEEHFRFPVTALRIDRRLLGVSPAVVEEPLEDYIVAMGLAAN